MSHGAANSGELLRPWSTPLIKATLEYIIGDRPSSTDPVQDRMWRSRAEDLMFWANRRPDVAARTLACSFFSETAVVPPPPPTATANANPPPKLPAKLHDMCEHALHVHASHTRQHAHPASPALPQQVGSSGAVAGGEKTNGIPQEEVTFMATLVEPCLRAPGEATLPNCQEALDALFSGNCSGRADCTATNRFLQAPLARLLCDDFAAKAETSGRRGEGTGEHEYCLAAEERAAAQLPLWATLPADGAVPDDTAVFFPTPAPCGSGEGRAADALAPPTPPFRVRAREEEARDAIEEDARRRSTTLVRAEERATIGRPRWAAQVEARYGKNDESPAEEATTKRDAVDDAPRQAAEGPVGEESDASAQAAASRNVEATVVEDGELVFLNGRFVGVEEAAAKRRRREREGAGEAEEEGRSATSAKPSRRKRQRLGDDGEHDGAAEPRTEDEEGPPVASPTTTTSRGGRRPEKAKRQSKKKSAQQGHKPLAAAVVSVQGVPLKSREELVDMVKALAISDTLRAAFLIGLEPPPAPTFSHAEVDGADALLAEASPPPPQRKLLHLNRGSGDDTSEDAGEPRRGDARHNATPQPAKAATSPRSSLPAARSDEPLLIDQETDSPGDDR